MRSPMHAELLSVAVAAAYAGGEVLLRLYGSADLGTEEKAKNDLVSRADRDSEHAIVERIRSVYPDHAFLAEEGGRRAGSRAGELEWIIDPLDGTTNFLRGIPFFCVSVACMSGGRPIAAVVLDPLRGDLFTATRGGGAARGSCAMRLRDRGFETAVLATGFPFKAHGAIDAYLALFRDLFLEARAIRRCGAAALDLAYTAAGVFDGFFEFRLSPWDVAAGALLVEEAGGVISDLEGGDRWLEGGNILAGPPGVHRRLLEIASRHASEAELDRLVPRKRA
ncbi:MAG TPA: inositol monophosphatase family protein [Thermoanaerobaculia bacterium]|nr:inositol monophosphatase family protein [Thermoanaerobaculia bacterium]